MADTDVQEKGWAAINVHKIVIRMIKSKRRGRVLDVGAGEGVLCNNLKKSGFDVSACDIHPKNFKCKDVAFKKADINKELPYGAGSFDYVCCVEVIEHIENPFLLLREIHRVLKKGGIAYITTPNLQNWYERSYYLASGRFLLFSKKYYAGQGRKYHEHLTPIFDWSLSMMMRGRFRLSRVEYNKATIPLLRIELPFKTRLTGDISIYEITKV